MNNQRILKNLSKTLIASALLTALSGCETDKTLVSPIATTSEKDQHFIEQRIETNIRYKTQNAIQTNSAEGVHVQFQSQQNGYSSISIVPDSPFNWKQLDNVNLAFDIANPGTHSVQLYLDIKDIDGDTYTRTVNVPVGATKQVYYAKMSGHDLPSVSDEHKIELNFTSGLRSNPDTWESDEHQFTSMWGKKNLNLSGIAEITLSVQSVLFDKEIILDNIRLRQNPAFNQQFLTKIVDKFGQAAKQDFVGKVHSEAELEAQRVNEAQSFSPLDTETKSKYGGWLKGPKLAASGFFRTEKVNGKWSLVDPDGYLYLATGLDIIRLSNSSTMTGYDFDQNLIEQAPSDSVTPEDSQALSRVSDKTIKSRFLASKVRADMFTWLPKYDEPLGKHYDYRRSAHSGPLKHGETYSFYAANLERKYGQQPQGYMQAWRDTTISRMLNWGFTSLGNWTDQSFYNNETIPYFANGWIIGDFKTISSGDDFWGAMPDVFDPKFEQRAFATAKVVYDEVKGNPWCVGIFIDNEKSFGRSDSIASHYGIVVNTLKQNGADVPTKAAFTQLMQQKYQNIDALNVAWNKSIKNWRDFNKGIDSSINNDQQIADYATLLSAYAEKYFSTVDKALQHYLPNHLYLGSRFPDWGMPIEVVKASAKYVDVISFNSYKEGLTAKSWSFLADIDMPSIIGEFHIGAKDSGLYHPGLILASDQKDRGQMYIDYMHSVIDNPYFVGAHWFQYSDSPITGRAYDGENYNVGFVSVTDTPYPHMVEAAKTVNSDMYNRRFGENTK